MTPKHLISDKHLEVGNKEFSAIPSWRGTYEALDAMAERHSGHEGEACVWKCAAINGLLRTQLPDAWKMAQHIQKAMADPNRGSGSALVEKLSLLGGKSYRSFASKYAHFFIDPNGYPIHDRHARRALAYHLGDGKEDLKDYAEYVERFECLRQSLESETSMRELDHYLWIAGQYILDQSSPKVRLSKDVKAFFITAGPTLSQVLVDLT